MQLKYKIDCPVSVLTPGRGKKRTIARGWLYEIAESGARIFLDEPLSLNTRVTLDVHLSNPDSKIITVRFKSVVQKVLSGPPFELALTFSGREDFIRDKVTAFHNGSQLIRAKGSKKWII